MANSYMLCSSIFALWFAIVVLNATVLRLPCMTYADFDVVFINKSLKGYLIRKDEGLNHVQCMVKCIEHAECRSYNTNGHLQMCELNTKAFGDAGTTLSDEPGWVHKSTDYSNKLVSMKFET